MNVLFRTFREIWELKFFWGMGPSCRYFETFDCWAKSAEKDNLRLSASAPEFKTLKERKKKIMEKTKNGLLKKLKLSYSVGVHLNYIISL